MITLASKWHQISSRGSAKRFYRIYPESIPPRLAPRSAQVRLRKTLDLCITGSRLSHLQRRKLSIAVSSDISMSNLVHPDTLSPRVPKLDLEFINASSPARSSLRLPPILQAQVLDRLHHMLPPGRTYPGQRHQNTSREVHFSHLLAQLILVIPSRFPRFAKATYLLHSHFLETYFHHTYTKPLLYTNLLNFLCNSSPLFQTPPHTNSLNF